MSWMAVAEGLGGLQQHEIGRQETVTHEAHMSLKRQRSHQGQRPRWPLSCLVPPRPSHWRAMLHGCA